LFNNVQNVQVSDTIGDATCTVAGNIKIIQLSESEFT